MLEASNNKKSPQKIKQTEALVRQTKVLNNKIKLVFQKNKRPLCKLNKEYLDHRRKYFFEDKIRVSLREIIQK